ncbi:hypothetical protein K438DRAFT_1975635 [Mycena galopus ATCC 62051]|nr:hypothetical protein K438DRAFT_1975635 [Mycena galopus ATCC 62051]
MASTSNRVRMVGLHKVAPGISEEDFRAKSTARARAFAALPMVQKHALKFELSFSNHAFNKPVPGGAMPTSEVFAMTICETASPEAMSEVLAFTLFPATRPHSCFTFSFIQITSDPEMLKFLEGAERVDIPVAGPFAADIMSLIDRA